jgi:hypothetical protein
VLLKTKVTRAEIGAFTVPCETKSSCSAPTVKPSVRKAEIVTAESSLMARIVWRSNTCNQRGRRHRHSKHFGCKRQRDNRENGNYRSCDLASKLRVVQYAKWQRQYAKSWKFLAICIDSYRILHKPVRRIYLYNQTNVAHSDD